MLVRWHVQHEFVVIPALLASRTGSASNADVGGFELSADQMAALDALGRLTPTSG